MQSTEPETIFIPTLKALVIQFTCIFRSASSPTSPSRRTTQSCKGRLVKSSYRESFKQKPKKDKNGTDKDEKPRRPSVVQMELNKQKPKLDTKLYPNYTDMPRMWAEVSDTQRE